MKLKTRFKDDWCTVGILAPDNGVGWCVSLMIRLRSEYYEACGGGSGHVAGASGWMAKLSGRKGLDKCWQKVYIATHLGCDTLREPEGITSSSLCAS